MVGMLKRLQSWANHKLEALAWKIGPYAAKELPKLAVADAMKRLDAKPISAVLVDNSVIGHGVTHETTWVDTGPVKWGSHIVPTGYAARQTKYWGPNHDWVYQNVCYLAGIAQLAIKGRIELVTSAELRAEQFRQPSGRYLGYTSYSHSIFSKVRMRSVDGVKLHRPIQFTKMKSSNRGYQIDWVNSQSDELFNELREQLGVKHSLDAWHIRTAEIHNLHCFMTMDRKLLNAVENQRHRGALSRLKTKILSPAHFAVELGIKRIEPHLLSYDNASFPVSRT